MKKTPVVFGLHATRKASHDNKGQTKLANKPAPKPTVAEVVDELGRVKAKKSDYEAKEKALRDQLVAAGIKEAEGKLFRCTVTESPRKKTDWKAVLEQLSENNPKAFAVVAELVQANTTSEDVVTVKVVSRH